MRHVDLGPAPGSGQTTAGDHDSEDWLLVSECPGHGAHDREQGRGDPHLLSEEDPHLLSELISTLLYYKGSEVVNINVIVNITNNFNM